MTYDARHKSRIVLEGPDRAPARTYFKAIGFTDADLSRPLVGVAHCWIEVTPCNWNHRTLAAKVKEGIRAAGGTPVEFNTVSVTDGIAMGTEGMKASLVSREVVADSVEVVALGHLLDAVVGITGCDKTIPGIVMALARLNIPGLMLYGGSIMYGEYQGRRLTVQDVFEAVGAFNAGRISAEELRNIETHACPGAGACGGQFTANTMATAFEMLGISPMGYNGVPATDPRKEEVAFECGRLVMELLRKGVTPRQIITRKALQNAIAGVMATGGSTNAVLHLLAVAREAGVKLSMDDFGRISARTPLLADLKPWGRFTAPEMYQAGGMAVVARRLLDAG
ncbi:MAG: dihydroxy-acid dehydratase, partial [candidate division NC10 bacterium]|nr:dihydroxy-acid dehydratase [candidate division NC10 bacterium]